jgi:NAD(P)-dependent dehydrogenase (short-subunit alcohol dehydrogenase family)
MKEKVAIVTGGSFGIGRASALGLATQGFKVLITGRRADRLALVAAAHPRSRHSSPTMRSQRAHGRSLLRQSSVGVASTSS